MQTARKLFALAGFLGLFSGCAVVLDDTPKDEDQYHYEYSTWESHPNSSTYEYVECTTSAGTSALCGYRPGDGKGSASQPDYTWQSNCKGSDCQIVDVFAHYSLQENLGTNRTLVIEAFNNAQFSGSPVANIQISGFDATRPNSSDLEEIYLAPGEYYFRAYFTTQNSQPVPYPMDGMILVGDEPVGVYGALSGAKRVLVKPNQQPEVLHIYIDQLFKKPGSEPDTNAHLRLHLVIPTGQYIPTNRDVRILLLNGPDIDAKPAYSFTVSSNTFLVKGQEGYTDYVTPSLAVAPYYIFVFLDADSNGYYDATELGSFYLASQEVSSFPVEANKTRSLQITLQPYANNR